MTHTLIIIKKILGKITTRRTLSTLLCMPFLTSQANELNPPQLLTSQSDFGGVGLMQMPTGRMAPEGEFNIGTSYNSEYRFFYASVQLFPWLESTIRYTQVQDMLYSRNPDFSGDTKYTDKGIDFKLRLLKESYWVPETSIGFRDFGGTGLFDGQFIAATKRFGPLDFTLGLGAGYIGNSGSLTPNKKIAYNNDCNINARSYTNVGKGGTIAFDRWFKGCMALYGGLEYQTPWEPLRVKIEYDANDYLSDFPVAARRTDMTQHSKLNYGMLYSLGDWGDLQVSYERGDTLTLGVNLQTNFKTLRQIKRDEPAPEYAPLAAVDNRHANNISNQISSKADSEQIKIKPAMVSNPQNNIDWDKVTSELGRIAGYHDAKIYLDTNSITVVAHQVKYLNRSIAHQRAATILANYTQQETITEYRIIESNHGQTLTETRINAAKFAQVAQYAYLNAKMKDSSQQQDPSSPEGILVASTNMHWSEKINFNIAPTMVQSFGGSENFYMFNIGLTGNTGYQFSDKLDLSSSVYLNIYDNYDQFLYTLPPDGTSLKRVRTLIRQYIHDKPLRMTNLQLTWMDKFNDNFYYQLYGGYLETMFGGIGSEVLYRPLASQWALGLDINYAKQRDPESTFGFFTQERHATEGRAYRVQTSTMTGHASIYYQPDWFPSTLLKVSAGKYLTEDRGITVDISKQFNSGVIIGAFATKTNLSAEEYGEGSYNKGFYISIPFDLMTVKHTQSRAFLSWVPLTRDGGQMLGRKYHLFELTDARSPWYTRPVIETTAAK